MNHYTKWNKIVKHLAKNEGIHSNITVSSQSLRAIWQEKTLQTDLQDYRETFHAQKYSSRQLIYTKATRIFLQHQDSTSLHSSSPHSAWPTARIWLWSGTEVANLHQIRSVVSRYTGVLSSKVLCGFSLVLLSQVLSKNFSVLNSPTASTQGSAERGCSSRTVACMLWSATARVALLLQRRSWLFLFWRYYTTPCAV